MQAEHAPEESAYNAEHGDEDMQEVSGCCVVVRRID